LEVCFCRIIYYQLAEWEIWMIKQGANLAIRFGTVAAIAITKMAIKKTPAVIKKTKQALLKRA
jgi:hypothetical protein